MTLVRRMHPVLLVIFILAGCASQKTSQSSPERSGACPDLLKAQAVTVFYLPTGKPYLTEQEHKICPSAKSLEIVSEEPHAKMYWKWDKNGFSRSSSPQNPLGEWNAESILAVYAGVLYGSGLLPVEGFTEGSTVSLEGQAYLPIPMDLKSPGLKTVFYRNQKTGLIDRVMIQNVPNQTAVMAILYNWKLSGRGKTLIPRNIDIFDITSGLFAKNLLIQIDYKLVQ
ncbi:MAG: hypothetical protein WHS88_04655 [Anaerohalosphaeraceae bacterium]